MELVNNCTECTQFDAETRELVRQFLSNDEAMLIAMYLAQGTKATHQAMAKLPRENKQRIQLMKQAGFAGQLLGKILNTFEGKFEQDVLDSIKKNFGMNLQLNQQKCPHKKSTAR